MVAENDSNIDVLISGAGPAGLMMACRLALHKISFRIIDKKTSPAIHSGALIVHARTLEILHQMGLAEKAMESGIIVKTINMRFNQRKNYIVDISNLGKDLTHFPYLLMLEQWKTENLLIKFINDHGHSVENNTTLLTFTQENEFVTSEIQKPDGTTELVKSRFLIGADGNNSLIRTQLNIPFTGKTHRARLFITDCKARLPLLTSEVFFLFNSTYTAGFFPLPDNRWRVDGLIPEMQQKEEIGFEDVRNFFGSNIHSEIELQNPQWFSVFRSHSRCAESYRKSRCFLLGDAAHVHSPVGAQGMNTGLQDAHNLAWKLAFFILGKAPEVILNTYHEERRPLALTIIRSTDYAYLFMTSGSFLTRFFRLQLVPLLLPMFLQKFKRNPGLPNRLFASVSGIGIKYKQDILSDASTSNFPDVAPKPGERFPDMTYETGGNLCWLYDGLNPAYFHLILFGIQELPLSFQSLADKFSEIISVKYIPNEKGTQHLFKSFGLENEGCYLVRPDLYVAWRSHKFDGISFINYLQKFLK